MHHKCTGPAEPGYVGKRVRTPPARFTFELSIEFDRAQRRKLRRAAGKAFGSTKVYDKLTDQEAMHYQAAKQLFASLDPSLTSAGSTRTTTQYRSEVRSNGGNLLGSAVGHIYARSRGGVDHPLNYMVVGASFNMVFGNVHDPVIAYMAGIGRTVLAYEICNKLEPAGGFADPDELYLHGKNAVWGCKKMAAEFFRLLDG